MLRVLSDILTAADAQQVTLLGLLDLLAAFECVDHQLLLQRLRRDFGFTETVLAWTTSFVTGRTQQVLYKDCLFSCSACPVWGPTGICPWPHTVCLTYGRNRPNRCLARAPVPPVCRRLPILHRHVSKCCSQCHRPAFALSPRRRCLDECQPTKPERQQDTRSAVARLPA